MGNYMQHPRESRDNLETVRVTRPKKRTRSENEDSDDEKERYQEEQLNTPKKKKLKTTSRYIYETLFVSGENSDVKIHALGKEWNLHKVYLCQSNYFSGMFSGSWRESDQDVIDMNIPDENIDEEALQIAFGSLYKDDVTIKPTNVVNVLAAATLLGLDGLIQQCSSVMAETISAKTVCAYHQSSTMYGQEQVTEQCFDWLEKNLMTAQSVSLLREIPSDLMNKLVRSTDLFVMQVEMDVYSLLKKWLFLKLNTCWEGSFKDLTQESESACKNLVEKSSVSFIQTERGRPFTQVFQALRYQHIINDLASAKIIEDDKIIPADWLLPYYRKQWLQMLKVEQGHDKGPDSKEKDNFSSVALRCGRVLMKDGEYCWRWTGYNFGVDLLVSFTNRLLIFKRNTSSQVCPGAVSLQQKRNIIYKLTVASMDTLGQTKFLKTSGVKKISLTKDEEVVVMSVDRSVSFPIHISCKFLLYTPRHDKKADQSNSSNLNSNQSASSTVTVTNQSSRVSSGSKRDCPASVSQSSVISER